MKQSSSSRYRAEYPKLIILSEGQERGTSKVCGAELQPAGREAAQRLRRPEPLLVTPSLPCSVVNPPSIVCA